MSKFITRIKALTLADVLALVTPLLLVVPNVALNHTEEYLSSFACILNVALPLAAYYWLMSVFKQSSSGVLWSLPLMVLAAFQIVLLYLYGGSIIAVDMFMNVATTSVGEASELLGCLTDAILMVCMLYLPPLILAVVLAIKRRRTSDWLRRPMIRISAVSTVIIMIVTAVTCLADRSYRLTRDLFPVNVINNIRVATSRINDIAHYHDSCSKFCYHASSTADSALREVYLLVIGETSRADNWELNGYGRHTNPRLSQRAGVVSFSRAVSQSNTTHKSVPMLMSPLNASTFAEVNSYKSVLTAFKEAGFHTMFFSNQPPNHSYNQFFGEEADSVEYVKPEDGGHAYDGALVDMVRDALAGSDDNKILIVVHTYGSHFEYCDRYPRSYAIFSPDMPCVAESSNRETLVNAYDNTIRYTDFVLDSLIEELEQLHCCSGLLYASDHGEDIFDDERGRFLHASPTPTYMQLHGAMLAWLSDEYRDYRPDAYSCLDSHRDSYVTPSESMYHTLIDLAQISTPYYTDTLSLTSRSYCEPEALYLSDLNEALPLSECGLRNQDIARFNKINILTSY